MDSVEEIERTVLSNELDYFLKEILPSEWRSITFELRQAFTILSGKSSSITMPSSSTLQNQSFGNPTNTSAPPTPQPGGEFKFDESSRGSLKQINYENIEFQIGAVSKGFLYLNGYHVISGKINMKLSKFNNAKLVETKIMNEDPYTIQQMQRCHRFTQNALEKLERVDFTKPVVPVDILSSLEDVMMQLQQSMDHLRTQDNSLFLQTHSSSVAQIQQSFHPALPSDLYMDFSVDNNKIKITLRGITFNSKGKSEYSSKEKVIISQKGVIGYFAEEYTILCESNFLNRLITHLKTAFKILNRLITLLKTVFNIYHENETL